MHPTTTLHSMSSQKNLALALQIGDYAVWDILLTSSQRHICLVKTRSRSTTSTRKQASLNDESYGGNVDPLASFTTSLPTLWHLERELNYSKRYKSISI